MTGCIDEPALQERLAYNLTHQGYTVEIVSDGNAALEVARSFQPDLILLDVMLPGLDGFEVYRILRQEMNVPILMLTARNEVQNPCAVEQVGQYLAACLAGDRKVSLTVEYQRSWLLTVQSAS